MAAQLKVVQEDIEWGISCSKIADAEDLNSCTLQRSNHRTYEEATRQATVLPLPQPHLEETLISLPSWMLAELQNV